MRVDHNESSTAKEHENIPSRVLSKHQQGPPIEDRRDMLLGRPIRRASLWHRTRPETASIFARARKPDGRPTQCPFWYQNRLCLIDGGVSRNVHRDDRAGNLPGFSPHACLDALNLVAERSPKAGIYILHLAEPEVRRRVVQGRISLVWTFEELSRWRTISRGTKFNDKALTSDRIG